MVHEFPNAPHPGIAARARGGLPLEAVIPSDERVEIGLDPHPAKLLPAFHRIHRRPTVRIAVDEQDRTRREVERELRDEPRVVLVAPRRSSRLHSPPDESIGNDRGQADCGVRTGRVRSNQVENRS